MNKKGGLILWTFVGALAIIFYVFAILLIFGSHININIGLSLSTEQLKTMPTFHKLISSRECLSTGRVGILNKTVLDDVNGGGELSCAYLPGVGYYTEINDLENNKKWSFGYEGQGSGLYSKSFVLIKYPNGEIHQGEVKFYSSLGDPVVKTVYAAEKAWMSSEPLTVDIISEKSITLKPKKVCYGNEDVNHCKKLMNSKLNVGTDGVVFDSSSYASITFSKTNVDNELRLNVKLNKIPVYKS